MRNRICDGVLGGERFHHCFFFSSRRRHTRLQGDWSSDVCSSDLTHAKHTLGPSGGVAKNPVRWGPRNFVFLAHFEEINRPGRNLWFPARREAFYSRRDRKSVV